MSRRALIHLFLVVLAALGILLVPEFSSSERDFGAEPAESIDVGTNRSSLNLPDALENTAPFPGIRGLAMGLDGAGIGGLWIEVAQWPSAADAAESTGRAPSAISAADGSFELFSVDPNSTLAVRGRQLALIVERRSLHEDGSISALLVLAPTVSVAGRVLGNDGKQRVVLRATHSLPTAAHASPADREVDFERTLMTQMDGSFDFGRVPCSSTTVIETIDKQGRLQRAQIPAEGTQTAVLDLSRG